MPPVINFNDYCFAADDWGFSPGVNRGILKLAQAGIIRKISVMSTNPYVAEGLEDLLKLSGIKLGLHFDLTSGVKGQSPARTLARWMLSRDQMIEQVRVELRYQLQSMAEHRIPIHHFDGHHHIHLLPGLLDIVADLLKEFKVPEVRLPLDWSLMASPQLPLVPLSLMMVRSLKKNGFRSSPFAYPPQGVLENPERLAKYLRGKSGFEILTHPAEQIDFNKLGIKDELRDERVRQYETLMSFIRTS